MTVICRDCAYCVVRKYTFLFGLVTLPTTDQDWEVAKCSRPMGDGELSLVSGRIKPPETFYCENAREFEHLCGEEGRYFEPKSL